MAGGVTLDLRGINNTQYSAAAVFRSVYFERTQDRLLYARFTRAVSFDGCTFMGHLKAGEFVGYTFDTSADIISFGTNHWYRRTMAPAQAMLHGDNRNLSTVDSVAWSRLGDAGGQFTSRQRTFGESFTFDLVGFHRAEGAPNDATNQQQVTGILTLNLKAQDQNGVGRSASMLLHLAADTYAAGNVTLVSPKLLSAQNNVGDGSSAVGIAVRPKAGATPNDAIYEVEVTGVRRENSLFRHSFEYTSMTTLADNPLEVRAF